LLREKRLRRAAPDLVCRLRIDSSRGRQRIDAGLNASIGSSEEDQAFRSHVAGNSTADAVRSGERCTALRAKSVCIVPKSQISGLVRLNLNHKVWIARSVFQKIRFRSPFGSHAVVNAAQSDDGHSLAGVEVHQVMSRKTWIRLLFKTPHRHEFRSGGE